MTGSSDVPRRRAGTSALRRPVRPRGAGRRARRAHRRVREVPGTTRRSRPSCAGLLASYTGRPSPVTDAAPVRRARRRRAGAAQARGPQPHRLAQDQQRPRPGAADPRDGQDAGSSPRPAPASTASPPRRPPRCWASSASSTWARRTPGGRPSTSRGCGCSAPRSCRSTPAARPSRTPSTRRCATGSPTSTTPTTSSAPSPDRTRSRRWSATSSGSSATRRAQQVLDLTGAAARRGRRLRRRRLQRDGHLHRVPRRRRRAALRLRGRRRGRRQRPARGPIAGGSPGVLHGTRTYVLQDEMGQTVAVALDLRRASTTPASAPSTPTCTTPAGRPTPRSPTREAMDAFALLCRTEGIIPAIESAHALAGALRGRPRARRRTRRVLVNLSGRGDKDVDTAAEWFDVVSDEEIVASAAAVVERTRRTRPARAGEHSVSRLADVLARRAEGRAALVGYLPAGYPSVAGRHRRDRRDGPRRRATSSRSACPTPTR